MEVFRTVGAEEDEGVGLGSDSSDGLDQLAKLIFRETKTRGCFRPRKQAQA